MTDSNVDILRRAYAAFAAGDVPTVLGLFSPDITWHVPGRSPLSGDYKGHEDVVGFFTKSMELSGGTLRIDVDELIGSGDTVVALTTVSARRNGQSWSSPEAHVWHVRDGKAVDFHEYQGDQQTEDEFWSS
jgi:ketosteroid isomerase-like protein